MSSPKVSSVGWSFWVKWSLATTLGWGLGWEVSWLVGLIGGFLIGCVVKISPAGEGIVGWWIFMSLTWFLVGGTYGTFIGTMQRLVLRRYIVHSGWWVLLTAGTLAILFVLDGAIMWGVKTLLMLAASETEIDYFGWPRGLPSIVRAVVALTAGCDLPQTIVHSLATTVSLVIFGTALGIMQLPVLYDQIHFAGVWVLIVAVSFFLGSALALTVAVASIFYWYVFGLGTGAITGLCLVLLLSKNRC